MYKNKLVVIVLVSWLGLVPAKAQQNTASPYSRFGIGNISMNAFGPARAMGNTSVAIRLPNHINYLNPAAYISQDSMSFIFDVGVNHSYYIYENNQEQATSHVTSLDHMAISFPVTKWWASSIGITPMSQVGYRIKEQGSLLVTSGGERESILYDNLYEGNGGLNRFYIGNGVRIGKYFAAGFNVSYIFGSLDKTISNSYLYEPNTISTVRNYSSILGDLYFDGGVQVNFPVRKKDKLILGATFSNNQEITAQQETYIYNSVPQDNISDTISYSKSDKNSFTIPRRVGLGMAYHYNNSLYFTAEYTLQNWSEAKFFGNSDSLVDSDALKFGLQYVKDPFSLTSYWDRLEYRLGFHAKNTYLQLHDQQLKDIGMSFGLGIPLRNGKSMINLTFELGQWGTTDYNLIRETYGKMTINLSLYDFWFRQRKFD
jgi:hypothetical protein